MKKADAVWLVALPVYQIIGTARHELSHALVAAMQGARITEIQLLPSIHPGVGLLWGFVNWEGGHPNWIMTAAPYLSDVLVFIVFVLVCSLATRMPRWLWINCLVIGLLSPVINTAYNYSKLFWRSMGDVNYLASVFPSILIHAVFLAALAGFITGICFALRIRRRNHPKQDEEAPTIKSTRTVASAFCASSVDGHL